MFRTAPMLLLAFVTSGGTVDDEVTAEQFLRLVKAQQSLIQDVAFAFEGKVLRFRPGGPAEGTSKVSFQGRYALRSDGATYLEHFYEGRADDRDSNVVKTVLRGMGEEGMISRAGKVNRGHGPAKVPGGPGWTFKSDSPETFTFLWRYQTLKGPSDFGFAFLGWEQVDSHRCAHIQFNPHPNAVTRAINELWVDLERGGHPLRIKHSAGQDTIYEVDRIELGRFKLAAGEEVWFPISGRYNDYLDYEKGTTLPEPSFRTLSYVLDGTLVFNQGLKDGVFHIQGDSFRPSFEPKAAKPAPPPKPRASGVDFEDAERKLDAALADPSRPKVGQDAATSAREEGWRSSLYAWLIGGLGLVALLAAGGIALRRRSPK